MEAVGSAASIIGVIELSAKLAKLCVEYSRDVTNAAQDIARLQKQLELLGDTSRSVQDFLSSPSSSRVKNSKQLLLAVHDSLVQLQTWDDALRPRPGQQRMRRFGLRSFKWPFQRKEFETTMQHLSRSTEAISLALQVAQLTSVADLERKITLDRLPIAKGAFFDSYAEEYNATCLPYTRTEVLRTISAWVNEGNYDGTGKPVFWLNGMVGTGKSTILRTVAQQLSGSRQLGATFFFNRGELDRNNLSKFFTTLAADLVTREPALVPHIQSAIDADPNIATKNAKEQFAKLIVQPLLAILSMAEKPRLPLVMIIDAVDECEREEDVQLLVQLLCGLDLMTSRCLKVLLASRPELSIRRHMTLMEGRCKTLVLHDMPESIIERDLLNILKHELVSIRQNYNATVPEDRALESDWPGNGTIEKLVKMASPLFIFVATMCRFLADRRCGNPNQQLQEILQLETRSQESQLDATYLPVVSRLVAGLYSKQKKVIIQQFRDIVGPIIVLTSPLSSTALSYLLDIPRSTIDDRLDLLHSVLKIPASDIEPIRLLHLSFRDFLVDEEKRDTSPFWIDEQATHKAMANHCLRILTSSLRRNICNLTTPGTPRACIPMQTIAEGLPAQVQYACMSWVSHIHASDTSIGDDGPVSDFISTHLLHWIESISIMGRTLEVPGILETLKSCLEPQNSSQLSVLLEDGIWFASTNSKTIDRTPLQLYSSLLAFAPEQSRVRRAFEAGMSPQLSLRPKVGKRWEQCLQVLEGHTGVLDCVAFSHDSTLLASAASDCTIRLWDVASGKCKEIIQGHNDSVRSIAFSHDSKLLLSSSQDNSVRVWRTNGDVVHILTGHTDWVLSAVFSHDSTLIVSGSDDKTVRVWNADAGECVGVLYGHEASIRCVAFSPDSSMVASASSDMTIRIWPVSGLGECLRILRGHTGILHDVSFSHDSSLLVSASHDKTVRIWKMETGECIQTLVGHAGPVRSISLSAREPKLVVSTSHDQTTRIWHISTGSCLQVFHGHTDWCTAVSFSHDAKYVASASVDKTARVWSTDARDVYTTLPKFDAHNGWVRSVIISPDRALIASASYDNTLGLWSVDTGERIHVLKGHTDSVRGVEFSHNSKLLLSSSHDTTIRVWQVKTGICLHVLQGHSDWAVSALFSHDSALIVSASDDKTVKLWETRSGECLDTLQGHTAWVLAIALSRDSSLAASASHDNTARIWSIKTGACLNVLVGHTGAVCCVEFLNLSLLASGSEDKTVRLWRLDTGECIREIGAMNSSPRTLAFSKDSEYLAVASSDCILQFFLVSTGECLGRLDTGAVLSTLSFDPDVTLRLHTDIGVMDLQPVSKDAAVIETFGEFVGLGISKDRSWITWNGDNWFWLPLEARPYSSDVVGSTVVTGSQSGRVTIMRFYQL